MKIGTLCKVTAENSHNPSQFGNLIVVCDLRKTRTGGHVVTGTNLKTGKQHHYFTKELKEVKQ
tara:strand:- start:26 stop:214 length:189 start_codon:yes stop_codon:yes gene_type:complete